MVKALAISCLIFLFTNAIGMGATNGKDEKCSEEQQKFDPTEAQRMQMAIAARPGDRYDALPQFGEEFGRYLATQNAEVKGFSVRVQELLKLRKQLANQEIRQIEAELDLLSNRDSTPTILKETQKLKRRLAGLNDMVRSLSTTAVNFARDYSPEPEFRFEPSLDLEVKRSSADLGELWQCLEQTAQRRKLREQDGKRWHHYVYLKAPDKNTGQIVRVATQQIAHLESNLGVLVPIQSINKDSGGNYHIESYALEGPGGQRLKAYIGQVWDRAILAPDDVSAARAIAEFEWLFFAPNAVGRGSAAIGDTLSSLLQKRTGFPIRSEFIRQDFKAIGAESLEDYIEQRSQELLLAKRSAKI